MSTMRARTTTLLLLAAAFLALSLPVSAHAAEESASTARWPWSGYWWPMLEGNGTNLYSNGGALQKYDQYLLNTTGVRGQSQQYEYANFRTTDRNNSWWGYCHAWAAAAILTREPPAGVNAGGVAFNLNDTRALTTKLYYTPTFTWLSGTRVDNANDRTSNAFRDIHPAWMDWLLRYYVRYYRYPFIMDIDPGSQVWNFPVFAYHRSSTPLAGGAESVRTTVWFSNPVMNATGTRYFSRTYTYTLSPGTLGQWTGNSVTDHPDFAWVPTGKRPVPHVSEATVERIIGIDV